MSWLSSALTPSGSHAKKSQEKRQKKVATTAGDLLPLISDDLKSELEFAHSFEPTRRAIVQQLLSNQGSGNLQANADNYRRAALSNAGESGAQEANMLKGQGYGAGATQGAMDSSYQNALRDANTYQSNLYSPDAQTARQMQQLQTLGYAMTPTSWGNFDQAASAIYGEPPVQVGPSPLDYLSQIAGAFMGGGGGAPKLPQSNTPPRSGGSNPFAPSTPSM